MKIKKLIGLLALTSSIFLTSCGVGPAVKELKKINDETARYWIKFIKENGINAIDRDGDVLITWAADVNNTALVKACIKSGADVNINLNEIRLTPLQYALCNDNPEMIKALVNNKAVLRTEFMDHLNSVANKSKAICKESVDAIMAKTNSKMLDYSNSDSGVLYNCQGCEFNTYFFECLEKKGYKPSTNDCRRLLIEWYNAREKPDQAAICEKILEKSKDRLANVEIIDFSHDNTYYTNNPEDWRFKFFKYQIDSGQSSNTEAVYSAPINYFTGEHVLYAVNEYIKHDFKKIVLRDVLINTDLNTFSNVIETLKKNNIEFEYFKSDLGKIYNTVSLEDFYKYCELLNYNKAEFFDDFSYYFTHKYNVSDVERYISYYEEIPRIREYAEPYKDNIKEALDALSELEKLGFDPSWRKNTYSEIYESL